MAGRLSFSIAINLLTENFKKGTSSVQQGLRSMQMQVLTFAAAIGGVGFGLTDFVSNLINTARETGRVTTALKNVSGSTLQYAENQRFLLRMAKKYGSEVNALTNAYAKFTAAASTAGMAVSNQQKIFESVSRATTAFGLSADDSNAVFLALSQMMSKGKISAEELRGQMGERLPIAFQAMAKAAGTSVAGLDKLMKAGSVMSADVLPKFADALNAMIPNVNTDNAETSVNRLQNAFTEFTKGTGIQSAFKSLIDRLTNMVSYAGNNIKSIISSTVAFIIGVSLGRLFKWISTQLAISQRQAMFAAAKSAKAAGQSFDAAAWKAQSSSATISVAFTRAGAAIKSAFMSVLPTAIFITIAELIAKGYDLYTEYKRINSIFSDYKNEVQGISHTPEIIQLQVLKKIAEDTSRSYQERSGALDKINGLLGTNYSIDKSSLTIQGDINKKIAERINLLKAGAEVDFFTRKKLETEDKLRVAKSKAVDRLQIGGKFNPWNGPTGIKTVWNLIGNSTGIDSPTSEIKQLEAVLKDANARLEAATAIAGNRDTITTTPYVDDPKKEKETPLEKAEDKYAKDLLELKAKLKLNIMSSDEFDKAFDELNKNALVEAMALKDNAAKGTKYLSDLQSNVANPRYNEKQAKLNTASKDYSSAKLDLDNKRAAGDTVMTQKQYDDALNELIKSTLDLTGSIMGADAKATELYNQLLIDKPITALPAAKSRDKTYDYKKTKSDIAGENLDVAKENLESIKKLYDDGATELLTELNKAMGNVTTLEDALKIATVKQDIIDLSKEIDKGMYSGIKDVASSADRMVSSFQNIREVFNNVDSSGWERIMAVWNALVNTVDGFMSILEMINNLTELTNKLAAAKQAEAAIDKQVTADKVSNAAIGMTADITAAGVTATTATTEVAANTAAGTTAAVSSAASLPFPFNLLAMAGAAASALAIFSSIPKFESGGIVGGTSYTGDKILTRLNSGEMVLNKRQQGFVGTALDNAAAPAPGKVNFESKVRGADLYLTMKNYMKQTGKKL